MANSLHFDGVDLSGSTYGVTLMKQRTQYPVMALPKIFSASVAQRHGGFTYGGRGSARVIPVRVAVQGSSFSDLMDKVDALNYLMAPENGEKSIRFDYISGRYWLGRLSNSIQAPPIGSTGFVLDWDFLCSNPNAYSTTQETETITLVSNPQNGYLPLDFFSVIEGNVETFPVWKFKNTNASDVTSITLENTTTNQKITVTKTLQQNEYLKIDSQREAIEFSTDDSTYTNVNEYRSNADKTFPTLDPQVSNTITITGITTGTCDCIYRARYRS